MARKKRLSGVATGQPRRIDYRQAGNQAVTSTPDAEPVERQVFSEFMIYELGTSLRDSLDFCNLESEKNLRPQKTGRWLEPSAGYGSSLFRHDSHQTFTALTVRMISAATLYGSAFDAGRRSSSQPFQPFWTVATGIRMDAPRSETPKLNLSID
jgi:hypothetical protein